MIAQIILARVYLVTRRRGYQLLEHPQIQRVLAHPPTASVTGMNTGEVYELFDGGWLELDEGLPHTRAIVARHSAPPPGKPVRVGKRVQEWVYELFLTTLDADGFLVENVLDLYHGRGAFEAVFADEDVEEDPDRWCSAMGNRAAHPAYRRSSGIPPAISLTRNALTCYDQTTRRKAFPGSLSGFPKWPLDNTEFWYLPPLKYARIS